MAPRTDVSAPRIAATIETKPKPNGDSDGLLCTEAASAYECHQIGEPIVSLVGPSDLDYLIAKFALSRIGFGVLLLSTRLTPEACLKLMKENECRTVIQASSRLAFDLGDRTHDLDSSVSVYRVATCDVYRDSSWDSQPLSRTGFDAETASQRTAIVYHSSGSTGLPESIATAHCKLLAPIPTANGTTALTSSPLCHAFVSKLTIDCMMVGKCMYLTNANMPLTAQDLTEVCRTAQPHVFLAVPYVLMLMAEIDAGVSELPKCKSVVSSESQPSDELGDKLVEAGVNIEVLFAGTEPGMVGSSINRPSNDNSISFESCEQRLSGKTKENFSTFMKKMLRWKPEDRSGWQDIFFDEWRLADLIESGEMVRGN